MISFTIKYKSILKLKKNPFLDSYTFLLICLQIFQTYSIKFLNLKIKSATDILHYNYVYFIEQKPNIKSFHSIFPRETHKK